MTKQKRLFLAALRKCLGVAPAADAAGISRATAYRWRARDTAFAKDWDNAIEAALDDLETALHERAKAKDTLAAICILRNRRRPIYNDSQRLELLPPPPAPAPHSERAIASLAVCLAMLESALRPAIVLPEAQIIDADVEPPPLAIPAKTS
ncbi:MAG: hypothetical protein WCS70_09670 [Verrucomicrobiota bacterium]